MIGLKGNRQTASATHVYGRLLRSLLIGMLSAVILLATFMVVAYRFPQMVAFDRQVAGYVQSFASNSLTRVMLFLTTLGSAAAEIVLVVIVISYLFWHLHHVWEPVMLVICLSGAWLLNEVLKAFYQRARPDVLRLAQAGGYSFPSGHTMISLAFYGMLAYLVWFELRRRGDSRAWLPAVALVVLPLLVGLSRIYLGVHYPSDVLGGYAAGGAWLAACITALRAIRFFHPNED